MPFSTGSVIVAREDWRGYLHSAIPRLVVFDHGRALVDWSPAGTVGVYASSRHFPGREHIPRNERKLLTLETCRRLYTSVASEMGALNFVDEEHPSCTTLGWSAEGRFLGWYVNFQRPIVRTERGYDSMDLVVDLVVAPSYEWHWKDEDDFEAAVGRGIVDEGQRPLVEREGERVLRLIAEREGPFSPEWTTWRPRATGRSPSSRPVLAEASSALPGQTWVRTPEPDPVKPIDGPPGAAT